LSYLGRVSEGRVGQLPQRVDLCLQTIEIESNVGWFIVGEATETGAVGAPSGTEVYG
jgi:hypothetical protein